MYIRHHGWQRPLHPLLIVGMTIFSFLVGVFYCFLGLFLGNRIAEITVTSIFSFAVFSVIVLFIRCTAIDPTDKTSFKRKRKKKKKGSQSNGLSKLNYGFILSQIVVRLFKRIERKILKTFIRRKYLDPWKTNNQLEPLLPFPLVLKDDSITPDPKKDDISFCSLCDFEVKKHSKHCRTCNRCVEGFDHHCRWLNNCVGKKNYTTFILLLIFVLLMLIMEGGTAVAIFVRCFADRKGIEQELERRLYVKFPRGLLAAISVLLVLMTAYGAAALGQLFLFHVVLIRKGMRTYDYILAMREQNQSNAFEDSEFSSDESIDSDSSEKPTFVSRFICKEHKTSQNPQKLSIRIDSEPEQSTSTSKQGFHASIDPWKLIKMSKEKTLLAAEKARERLMKQNQMAEHDPLKPLPLEKKSGLLMNHLDRNAAGAGLGLTPLISKDRSLGSPSWFSSPRRRFSSSPTIFSSTTLSPKQRYKSNFDVRLTEVSWELESYISRQVLWSVLSRSGSESPPR